MKKLKRTLCLMLALFVIMAPVVSASDSEWVTLYSSDTMTDPATYTGADTEIYVNSTRVIDPDRPMVALTFDDGPSKVTPKILDILDDYGGVATFFVVGNRVRNYPKTMQRIVAQGSEIGNHTWDHPSLPKLSSERILSQLEKTNDAVFDVTGGYPKSMRPPYGSYNQSVKDITADLGLPIMIWSVDSRDWESRNATKVYNKIMNNVHDGAIILCHDLYDSTYKAMVDVIPALIDEGYQLVTVSELFRYSDKSFTGGKAFTQQ